MYSYISPKIGACNEKQRLAKNKKTYFLNLCGLAVFTEARRTLVLTSAFQRERKQSWRLGDFLLSFIKVEVVVLLLGATLTQRLV